MKKPIISDKMRVKVASVLEKGETFMLYRIPGYVPKLIHGKSGRRNAYIVPWRGKFKDGISITDTTKSDRCESLRIPESTSKQQYIMRVGALIESLAGREKAKTVISRIISGTNNVDWVSVADQLWETFPESFGYLFYSPTTGAWLGATPEKLLMYCPPRLFSTHALAGTLPVDVPWNVKNYEEHVIVSEYIENILKEAGVEYESFGPMDTIYGKLKHLCTGFSCTLGGGETIGQLIMLHDRLAPTPALAGYPIGDAFDDIDDIEDHERGCYGGYITVVNNENGELSSFVTIRCVQFEPQSGRWAVYTGGGITAKSRPEAEWEETEAKASKLIELINRNAQ